MKQNKLTKIITLIFIIFGLCSCSLEKEPTLETNKKIINDNENKEFIEPYIDDNPIQLGLYLNKNNTRTLITTFEGPFTIYKDIVSLEVYYTNETAFNRNQKKFWNQYYSNYNDIDNYKIGYHITFQVESQKLEATILKPSDAEKIIDYVIVYLYDDINQNSGWYDHITEEEMMPETILTSIKLTANSKITDITSPITVTAFTYDNDDFDELGNYRGNSSFKVTINHN